LRILEQRVSLIVAVVLMTACAAVPSPVNTTSWRDPGFTGGPFTKIMVVGLSAQRLTDQRGFENLMVSTLQSAGAVAVPGWQFVPTDQTPDETAIRAAVAKAGADATLIVRLSGSTTETNSTYASGVITPAGANMYVGWYEPMLVNESYQAATIYTTLFDVRTARPVWTFNPATYNPTTLQQDAPRFANEVAGLLRSNGFLPGP